MDQLLGALQETVNNVPSNAFGENALIWVYYTAATNSRRLEHLVFFTSRLVDVLGRVGLDGTVDHDRFSRF